MRIPVSLVLNLLANGKTTEEIIEDYPYLEAEDIQQSLFYGAWLAREQYYPKISKDDVLLQFNEELMAGAIISVKDDGFRVRLLPVK
jgi:hypothetical protein